MVGGTLDGVFGETVLADRVAALVLGLALGNALTVGGELALVGALGTLLRYTGRRRCRQCIRRGRWFRSLAGWEALPGQ